MKKVLFLSLAASAVMASCSNEVLDSVVPQEPQAISFENPFLDKGTRADLTTDNLTSFYVYGTKSIEPTSVFTNDKVFVTNGQWTTATPQYWENDTYAFAAYSVGEKQLTGTSFDGSNLTIASYETDGKTDLICSQALTGVLGTDYINNTNKVGLTFGHKLSKVHFTFTTDAVAGQTLEITNLALTNLANTGTFVTDAANPGTWSNNDGTNGSFTYQDVTLTGNEPNKTTEDLYMIPQTVTAIKLSFTATLSDGVKENAVKTFNIILPASKDDNNFWVINHIYNYTANITRDNITLGTPIQFQPSVSDWNGTVVEGNETTINPVE